MSDELKSAATTTTIARTVRAETKVRGSRFIATAIPVASREEAQQALETLRKEHWDATHNCYAYRLAPDGLQYRFSDDGEPSGTAGKPILFVLQQRELVDLLVVVTRYYGGTKLGAGGLARAYAEVTRLALDGVDTIEQFSTSTVRVFVPYDDINSVRQLVERAAERFDEEFRDVVTYTVVLRSEILDDFAAQLTEISQGRAGMVDLDQIEAE